MPLEVGSQNADSGMSRLIYEKLDSCFSQPLQEVVEVAEGKAREVAQNALDEARKNWRKLAYSIAFGVIEHIKMNMEINGIKTKGNVITTVKGYTNSAEQHRHYINRSGEANDVVFTQSNDGTGHVE